MDSNELERKKAEVRQAYHDAVAENEAAFKELLTARHETDQADGKSSDALANAAGNSVALDYAMQSRSYIADADRELAEAKRKYELGLEQLEAARQSFIQAFGEEP